MIVMTQKDLDVEIIKILQKDSRKSFREIAKQLDVSHVSVSSRVKSLEERGVIRGYTTIVNPDKTNSYILCLLISADAGSELSKIGQQVAENDEINVVMRVSGGCELLALAVCSSRGSALILLDKIGRIKGIDKVESHVVLEAIKLGGMMLKD